jgi:uncharacterized membrane protein YphA (DoxX/SURF4 family)
MSIARVVARPLIAWVFVEGGLDVLRHPESRAAVAGDVVASMRRVAPFLPDDDVAVVRANALAQVVAGTALATGRFHRLAALVLAGSLVPTTLAGHGFWRHDDPAQRQHHRVQFTKNAALFGGLLLLAGD